MPRGLLWAALQESLIGQNRRGLDDVDSAWFPFAAQVSKPHRLMACDGLSFLTNSRHHAACHRLGVTTAFAAPDDSNNAGDEAAPADDDSVKSIPVDHTKDLPAGLADAEKRKHDILGKGEGDYPGWENTEGLPTVKAGAQSQAFFSKDIADAPPESTFRPSLGCKCGDWSPAPAHPSIDFKQSFVTAHPDFMKRLGRLKVHMEDVTKPGTVHWDATYDLRQFLNKEDLKKNLRLAETIPAMKNSGKQLRFLTFCPPEGEGAHQYVLRVSALDKDGEPIEYFQDEEMHIVADPPAPVPSGIEEKVPGHKPGPVVATAKVAGPGQ